MKKPIWHTATIGKNKAHEGASIGELRANIVAYYSEDSEAICPEVASIVIHADEQEFEVPANVLEDFQKKLEAEFAEAMEAWKQPMEHEEHSTHWKACSL